jgi:hypothetical protein
VVGEISNGAIISPNNNDTPETFVKKEPKHKTENRTAIRKIAVKMNHKYANKDCGVG